jgi:O-succinylbenzoic acid--CoA ligase
MEASALLSRPWESPWLQLGESSSVPPVPERLLPRGPGLVIGSGGSTGGRRLCLQPAAHLDRSAAATAEWLRTIGMDPAACLTLNPLPMHHVSGLMPWWRSRCWGSPHAPLAPDLMKRPEALVRHCNELPDWRGRARLLSLVPTQLARLMAHPAGEAWLQGFAVIWVGGAALPGSLAARAREMGIRLAPCYGATETAAMVAALPPERFLAGAAGCGDPLPDVDLRLTEAGGLQVRTDRLACGCWSPDQPDRISPLADAEGWWSSGDRAVIGEGGLQVIGRIDTAVQSGGETVFPEQLEQRLMEAARRRRLPLAAVLLLGVDDDEWGARLVALIRPEVGCSEKDLLAALQTLTIDWMAAERPRRWVLCPDLAASGAGKWQRDHWRRWLQRVDAAEA